MYDMENASRNCISDHYLKVLLLILIQHKQESGDELVEGILNGLKDVKGSESTNKTNG